MSADAEAAVVNRAEVTAAAAMSKAAAAATAQKAVAIPGIKATAFQEVVEAAAAAKKPRQLQLYNMLQKHMLKQQ